MMTLERFGSGLEMQRQEGRGQEEGKGKGPNQLYERISRLAGSVGSNASERDADKV